MIGKFALLLCPVTGCSKVGLSAGDCPAHPGKALVRTVVWTDHEVQRRITQVRIETKPPQDFEKTFERLFGKRP